MEAWGTIDRWDALVTLGLPSALFLLFHHPSAIFGIALLAAAFVLTWLRPTIAITLLPLALPFYSYVRPLVPHHLYTTPLFVELVFCMLAVIGQTLIGPQRRSFRAFWRNLPARFAPFSVPAGLLVIAATLALTIFNTYNSRTAYLQTCAEPYVYAVLLLLVLRNHADLLRLIAAVLLAGLEVTINAFYQASYFTPWQVWEPTGAAFRAESFLSPNLTGAFLEYIAILLAALLFLDWSQRARWRLALAALLPVLLAGLYLTKSRGAWLFTALTALVLLALALPRRQRLVLGGVIAAGVVLIGPVLAHSLWTGHDGTAQSRLFIWLAALHMAADHPLRGIGFARFVLLYSPFYSHHPYWIPVYHGVRTPVASNPSTSQVDNLLLNFWLNTGLLGLASYLWILCQLARTAVQRSGYLRRLATSEALLLRRVLLGTCLGVMALTLHGLVNETYFTQQLAMLVWITMVVALVIGEPAMRARNGFAPNGQGAEPAYPLSAPLAPRTAEA
jgi:O-antigen ligase